MTTPRTAIKVYTMGDSLPPLAVTDKNTLVQSTDIHPEFAGLTWGEVALGAQHEDVRHHGFAPNDLLLAIRFAITAHSEWEMMGEALNACEAEERIATVADWIFELQPSEDVFGGEARQPGVSDEAIAAYEARRAAAQARSSAALQRVWDVIDPIAAKMRAAIVAGK